MGIINALEILTGLVVAVLHMAAAYKIFEAICDKVIDISLNAKKQVKHYSTD